MRAMEEKILREGKVLPGAVLNVGGFLNQRIDTAFLKEMAAECVRLYGGSAVTKVLTIEASGIPFATACAMAMGVPAVFAKKAGAGNVAGDVYFASVHSYTRNRDLDIVVSKEYLGGADRVLLVDDFLANGSALRGLMSLVEQAGAELVGAVVAVEKRFQGGGDAIRKEGVRVEALASIASMGEEALTFA